MKLTKSPFAKKLILTVSASALFLLISPYNWPGVIGWLLSTVLNACFIFWNKDMAERLNQRIGDGYYAAGLCLCTVIGVNFYQIRLTRKVINAYLFSLPWFSSQRFACFTGILTVLSVLPVSLFLSYVIDTVREDYRVLACRDMSKENKGHISAPKAVAILTGIYWIGISALVRSNFYYVDDLKRTEIGKQGWDNFSRYLSNEISTMINMDSYAADISPLAQMIAIAIMAFTAVMILYIVNERTSVTLLEIVALVPFALNPYFMECLSYKFDAPSMAVSIFGGVFPLLFRKKKTYLFVLMAAVGALVTCTTYQPSTSVFPMLVVFLALRMFIQKVPMKEIIRFCAVSAIGYSLGVVYFYSFLLIPFNNTYVSSTIAPAEFFISNLILNYIRYLRAIKEDFNVIWTVLVALLTIAFFVSNVYASGKNKLLSVVFSGMALGFMGLMSFGLYPALLDPIFAGRALYGTCILISLMSICVVENQENAVIDLPCVLIAAAFFSFSFTYGNCLSVQKEYTNYRIMQAIDDLGDLGLLSEDEQVYIEVSGSIEYSPVLESTMANYPVLYRLIPINFAGDWEWGTYSFFHYYGLNNCVPIKDYPGVYNTEEFEVLTDGIYHRISGADNLILIELK